MHVHTSAMIMSIQIIERASPLEQRGGPVARTHQSGIMCKWHYATIQEATYTEATHCEATRQHNDTHKCNRYYYTFIFGPV